MPNRPGNDDRTSATGGVGQGGAFDTRDESAVASTPQTPRARSNRGFASMDRQKQREIASKGGRAAHAKGTAHEFDSGEARDAGRKGGVAVSRNREHMAAIGRRGGEARGHARGAAAAAQTNTSGIGRPTEGAFQNSRGLDTSAERQVAIDNQKDGVGTRSTTPPARSDSSTLGDRRPMGHANDISRSTGSSSDETYGR